MNHTANWRPDPYGIHELRFFSADGKPTLLVMDGGKRSYERPPQGEPPPIHDPSDPELSEAPARPKPRAVLKPPQPPLPTPQPVTPSPSSDRETTGTDRAVGPTTALDPSELPLAGVQEQGEGARVGGVDFMPPTTRVHHQTAEPLGQPLKVAYGIVFGVLAVSLLGLLFVHLHHTVKSGSTKLHSATTTTVKAQQSTTTVAVPTALQTSPESAAAALVSNWGTGNRTAALTVATPAAVATLFALPYTSGLANDRGCSTSFVPIVCTYGPPGGASTADPIYQLLVSQASGGWYVSSVKVEH